MFLDLVHAPDWQKIAEIARITLPIHLGLFAIWVGYRWLTRKRAAAPRLTGRPPVVDPIPKPPAVEQAPPPAVEAPPVAVSPKRLVVERDAQGKITISVRGKDE